MTVIILYEACCRVAGLVGEGGPSPTLLSVGEVRTISHTQECRGGGPSPTLRSVGEEDRFPHSGVWGRRAVWGREGRLPH